MFFVSRKRYYCLTVIHLVHIDVERVRSVIVAVDAAIALKVREKGESTRKAHTVYRSGSNDRFG